MLGLPANVRVHLAADPIDLRRGHDGLVRNSWNLDRYEGHIFVFLGRQSDRVKVLFWDRNGFVQATLARPIPAAERCSSSNARRDRRHCARQVARRNRRETRGTPRGLEAVGESGKSLGPQFSKRRLDTTLGP